MRKEKDNRVVIITGASSGVGEGLKKLFQDNGDLVFNLSKSIDKEDEYNKRCDVTSEIDIEKTNAKLEHGILKIVAPKIEKEEEKTKKLAIE